MMAAAKSKARRGKGKTSSAKAAKSTFGGFGAQPKVLSIPTLKLSTGASIPAVGFGTYTIGGEALRKALDHAIATGYRHFDTARAYQNEAVVGAAIAASGLPREDFFITSKLWGTDHGEGRARRAIEASLSELGTEYVDLMLIHGPDNFGSSAEEKCTLRQETWRVLEEFHAAGTLCAIGCSNFEPRHIGSLMESGSVMPAVNQIEMHAYLAQGAVRAYCAEHDILVTAYGSVGAKGLRADPVVQSIAAAHKRTPAQVSLRHSLQRGAAVLCRSTTPKRITENGQLFDFELSREEVAALDALDVGTRSYWDNTKVP